MSSTWATSLALCCPPTSTPATADKSATRCSLFAPQTSMVRRQSWRLSKPDSTWRPIASDNTSSKQISIAASTSHSTISGGPRRRRTTNSLGIFSGVSTSGLIAERILDQVYSPDDGRFLPDRYIIGTCPHCGFDRARGDQCENCTRPLDPIDLIDPHSTLSGSRRLEVRPSCHLFLRQSALVGKLEAWIANRSGWPPLVTSIARKWLDEGIRDRCITRDLTWGVSVPKSGYEGKVFYVWFDAPIAYIAATKEWADANPRHRDWRLWWWEPRDVSYIQFLGKDNVPFHTVTFPSTLIGSGEPWKTVDIIKGFNWLTFEGGKFSTSLRRGVFLNRRSICSGPTIGAGGWQRMHRRAATQISPLRALQPR